MEKYSDDKKQDLIERLHNGPVLVSFLKKNGERRDMTCTLSESYFPAMQTEIAKQTRKENPDVQSVYDTTAIGWRSFRWENVIEYGDPVDVN